MLRNQKKEASEKGIKNPWNEYSNSQAPRGQLAKPSQSSDIQNTSGLLMAMAKKLLSFSNLCHGFLLTEEVEACLGHQDPARM